MTKMMNVGFGNLVNTSKIISIISVDSAPAKRMVQKAKETDQAVDATQGRRTKSLILTEGGYIVLSALQPETLSGRFMENEGKVEEKENE
ncbi:MAG: DUF370 domain-containing protein [Lachnospiraceae bacterium]